jgi:hypothetical protein
MALKYTQNFNSLALKINKNWELGFFARKYTIWQPWSHSQRKKIVAGKFR